MKSCQSQVRPGDRVAVIHGPLAGLNGTVRTELTSRVTISIDMGENRVLVEMDLDWMVAHSD